MTADPSSPKSTMGSVWRVSALWIIITSSTVRYSMPFLEIGQLVEGDAILLPNPSGGRVDELAMALLGHVVPHGPKGEFVNAGVGGEGQSPKPLIHITGQPQCDHLRVLRRILVRCHSASWI